MRIRNKSFTIILWSMIIMTTSLLMVGINQQKLAQEEIISSKSVAVISFHTQKEIIQELKKQGIPFVAISQHNEYNQ